MPTLTCPPRHRPACLPALISQPARRSPPLPPPISPQAHRLILHHPARPQLPLHPNPPARHPHTAPLPPHHLRSRLNRPTLRHHSPNTRRHLPLRHHSPNPLTPHHHSPNTA